MPSAFVDHVLAGVAAGAELDDLLAQLERVGDARDDVRVVVLLGPVGRLAVVDAERDHAVVAGALQPAVDQVLEALPDLLRRPVEEDAEVALVFRRRC